MKPESVPTVTRPPGSVNFTELLTRFVRICPSRSGSPRRTGSPTFPTRKRQPSASVAPESIALKAPGTAVVANAQRAAGEQHHDDGRRGSGEVARTFAGRSRSDYRNGNYSRWTNNWRNDRRYDWRNYRDRHRSTFHLGFYYDPFGWGYQPFGIGYRLWPNYYSSNYWINDPYEYRLPYAPPGTRWIRYYNDALLVDVYTGEVVDAIRGFFW